MSELLPSDQIVPSDTDLVHRWMCAMRVTNPRVRYSRREAVQKTFAVGFTSAGAICRRHGFDPDEKVRKP